MKSINGSTSDGLAVTVRDIAYSVGQRDWITDQRVVSLRDFIFAYDSGTDSLLPAGVRPSDFASLGCELTQLASTHGQGHSFTLYKATCGRQAARAAL
ncbi:MAG TPA: hypothetical protein VM912_13670 [Terriglobales bacterium]|nr:hypothetical protein [Terriglobales bacterium]